MTAHGRKTTIAERHCGFAARIAARHGFAAAQVSGVARHRRRPAGFGVSHVHARPVLRLTQRWSPTIAVTLSPRFELRTERVTRLTVVPTHHRHLRKAAPTPGRTDHVAALRRAAPPPIVRSPADQLIRFRTLHNHISQVRLVRTLDRAPGQATGREAPQPQHPPTAPGPRREIAVASLARNMVRAAEAPLAAAVGRLESVVSRLANQAREEIWPPGARPMAPAPMPDTRLIAEQVLRTLDHRVIALRERMGRR